MTAKLSDPESSHLLDAIQEITSIFNSPHDPGQLYQRLLDVMLNVTGGQCGLLSELMHDKNNQSFIRAHAIVHPLSVMPDHPRLQLFNAKGFVDMKTMDWLSEQVLVKGEPFLSDQANPGLFTGGFLDGFQGLQNCMAIPVCGPAELRAMIVVANRQGAYPVGMLGKLEPLVSVVGSLLVSMRNQRERVLMEQQLLKAREASAKANECRVFFLASISHEIRTPMNAIVGMCDLLKDTQLSASQMYYTEVISRHSDALLSMVDEVLDVAELEAGKMEVQESEFCLETILIEASQAVEHKLLEKSLEMVMAYPPHLPRHMLGDAGKIRQILVNLADNAIKFTDAGHVLVEVTSPDPARLVIKVIDTGDGISRSALPQLFELFHQGDQSLSRKHGGTGLGLGLSQRLAALMGGRVGASSQKGLGSCFMLELPLRLPASPLQTSRSQCLESLQLHVLAPTGVFSTLFEKHLAHHDGCTVYSHLSWESCAASIAARQGQGRAVLLLEPGLPGLPARLNRACRLPNELNVFHVPGLDESCFLGQVPKFAGFRWFDEEINRLLHQCNIHLGSQLSPPQVGPLRPSILLVEDNPINQDVASLLLTQMGCLVDVAFNGVQALEKYLRCTYDLIFMDCQMPVMDGLTATSRIRDLEAHRRLPRTPIVAITANALASDRQVCLSAGMDDYLSKPFKRAQVKGVLERFVHRNPEGHPVFSDGDESVFLPSQHLPVFDHTVMMEVADSDQVLVSRILKRYKALLPGQVEQLFQLFEKADAEKLCAELHRLRGGAAGAGFSRFAGVLSDVEQTIRERRSGSLDKAKENITLHMTEVLEFPEEVELLKWCASRQVKSLEG